MKNKIILIIFIIFTANSTLADNLFIQSKSISLDKNKEITIFENEVLVKTEDNNEITSEYAEYEKKKGYIKFKKKVKITDFKNNVIETNYAEYDDQKKVFKSQGPTKILTSENYTILGEDILFDNNKGHIQSKNKTIIFDQNKNKINLENFNYDIKKNIFKSIGFVKIEDLEGNSTEFSQIYIDTKKKEILGTDIKSFLNQKEFKVDERNKPRIFANTVKIENKNSTFDKSVFTICDYRENDKCPPWILQSKRMTHDKEKKTIFYNNAIIKVYDIPIFYTPYLSHPDPSVNRRTGFLPPSFSDSKNLGSGLSIPYFFNINKDKDFTITNKLYVSENPLFLGEYRQAFKTSNLILDFGYTDGYKKTSSKKKPGKKHHFFTQFTKSFDSDDGSNSFLDFNLEDVSNDKYLELYKVKTDLVDYNNDFLESSLSYNYEKDNIFLRINSSVYETLKDNYNDKYEYILPEITYDNNLFSSDKFGNMDFQSNFKVHNYDTNKTTKFLVNDFDWNYKDIFFDSGVKGKIIGNFKNVNYETKNVSNTRRIALANFTLLLAICQKLIYLKDQMINHIKK